MRPRVTQIGVAMMAMLALLIGMATMNASASYPSRSLSQGITNGTDADVAKQIAAGQPLVRAAEHADVSIPLRDYAERITEGVQPKENENPIAHRRDPGKPVPNNFNDTARQSLLGPLAMPTPIVSFEGMYNFNGFIPPDTNGDIGRNQYVQTVNSTLQVYSRTGTSLYGPTNINTLWTGFGTICETANTGDPIVLYDPMAGRWLISQFTGQSNPTHQCIAISTSEDATGAYYRYDFITSPTQNSFEDYPHFGVWPDAYYMTTNEFGGPAFGGNYAFERDRMLRGDASARMVYFGVLDGGFLPSDVDGDPPPTGSPNYFINFDSNATLSMYKFHVDWTNPALSTFTGPINIPVTPFDFDICSAGREACIDQPGTTARLEAISDRMMFRLAYRNFGAHESLVVNHTVDGNGAGIAGIRWYELRSPNTTPTVYQQGTYSPADNTHRWMGSIAMDRQGNMALGFSASSTTLYPSIRYAGRLVTDPLGQLAQGEATLIAGGGSETNPAAPRWGDYSSMSVDPVDECTFWYTQEYFAQSGPRNWRTRVGSFRFPGCVGGTATPVATSTALYASPTRMPATATPCPGYASYTGTITNTDGVQMNRVLRSHPPSSCLNPNAGSVNNDGFNRHYDSYNYTNSTGATQCVTIRVTNACGDNTTGSAAYLNTFDPNNVAANYLGDYGEIGGPEYSYSVNVPAGQTLVVVVHELSPNLGCATYSVSINPCAPPPSPTATATGGVSTSTPVLTPSPSPTTVCVGTTYQAFPSSGATMLPATNDIGNHCDDCLTAITLPFTVDVYGTPYTSAMAGSNGMLNFNSTQQNIYTDNCVPVRSNQPPFASTVFAYYDDLRTDVMTGTHGIYTDVVGTAPNRQFVIRWQTTFFDTGITGDANFEIVLHENSSNIEVIYGQIDPGGSPGMGIQLNLGQYTSFGCHVDPANGDKVTYIPIGCGVTPSPTVGQTTPTATACAIEFSDVPPNHTFYPFVRCLACRGIINGYPDGTFKPDNHVTRGQLAKIVSNSAGFTEPVTTQTFEDVVPGSTFYEYIERLATREVMGGYLCGVDPSEPCVPPDNRPYFRPNAGATRGQLTKIVSNAAGFNDTIPDTQYQFTDVEPGSTFWLYVERLLLNRPGVMSGYPCGGPGEPCDSENRPYFRPNNPLTRGQTSKIVANTFFPGCQTPARR